MATELPDPYGPNEDAVSFAEIPEALDGRDELGAFFRYNAWRYAANAEWLGAIALNIALTEAPTPARWAAAGVVGLGVTFLENRQTDYAAQTMEEGYKSRDEKPVHAPTVPRELFALGASIHQGAGASVEINDALGLPNTTKRRRLQAMAYAGAVGVWASPPANELGQEALDQIIDHPWRTALITLVGSIVGKFVVVDGIRKIRQRLQVNQES